MFRIDTATAAVALPAPSAVGTPGYFAHAPAGSGVPPTVVSADWFNTVQEELIAICVAGGIALDKTDHGQVLAAILALAGSPASASDIWVGTSNTRYATALAIKQAMVAQALTDASTIAWNMNLGFRAKVTLGGNRTLGQPTNLQEGATGSLAVKQDGTGSRTLAYAACWDFRRIGVTPLSTGANKLDLLYYEVVDAVTPQIVITQMLSA